MNNVSVVVNKMSIRCRDNGLMEGRLTVNGKRKSFYGRTKKEVKEKAAEYLQKIEYGYRDPQKIILNDYIVYWMKTYKWNKVEPSTYTRLYRVYEKQIHDTIGGKMIGDISTKDIQQLIDEYANPSDDSIKPLAMSGLRKIMHLLSPCMRMAVKEEVICKNPCDNVIMPHESCIAKETKQQRSLTDEEIKRFKEAALQKHGTGEYIHGRNGIVLLLILNLGLRLGEALALDWSDIDMNARILHINKTVQSGIKDFSTNKTYDRVKRSAKTKSGVRVLAINDTVLFYLNELKAYDRRNHITSDHVCCTSLGDRSSDRDIQRSLERVVKRAGIQGNVSAHTLRHTFGSTLLRNGVDIVTISKLMGHANVTVTMNKYLHTVQELEAKAMYTVKIC